MAATSVETEAEAELACQDARAIVNGLNVLKDDASKAHTVSEMKKFARDGLKLSVSGA